MRRRAAPIMACVACATLAVGVVGCGGSASTAHSTSPTAHSTSPIARSTSPTARSTSTSNAPAAERAVWASRTQQLCREKRAAIMSLGNIHITYGGIRRVGLPAVQRIMDRYLARLLAVLRAFSQRQQQFATPPQIRAAMAQAAAVDRQSQSATKRLRTEIARFRTPAAFAAAFRVWIATTERLAARGDALARQLDLPACRSGADAISR